jgi:hypothetical protein
MSTIRTYRGSCHCGAVRFAFRSEEITSGARCNCSLCSRRGAVVSSRYYAAEEIEEIVGKETLTVYLWGDRMMNHYFCPRCGVFPFSDVIEPPARYRINLGCVEDLDPLALDVTVLDGRSF